MRRAAIAAALALWLLPAGLSAVQYIDINAPGAKRMPVALPDFVVTAGDPSLARMLPSTIAGDLEMSRLFDVIPSEAYLERIAPKHFSGTRLSFPDWKLSGAEAVLIGRAEVRGSQVFVEVRLYDATLGNEMTSKSFTGPVRLARKIAHKLANKVLEAFTGTRGIFDTEIAFSARPQGGRGKEIYTVAIDGQDLRKFTSNRSFNLFPRWSSNGRYLAYTSFRTGVPGIYVWNLEQGVERVVLRDGNSKSPGCFSADGRWLYLSYSISGNSDIYRVPSDGGSLEKAEDGWGIEVSPSLSPDGRMMAFVSDRGGSPQVYVKPADGNASRRVSAAGYYSTSPNWSPAGDLIAFTSQTEGRYAVYVVRPDGSGQRLVAASSQGDCLDPCFSPDGRYLVYTFRKKGYSELKIVSADGRWERRLFSGLSGAGSPSWSPRR